jgi:PAS domain-containing protein
MADPPAATSAAAPSKRMTAANPPSRQDEKHFYEPLPELQLIYDTAPVGLAFLTPDCRYLQVNQRLTEICGISVADHIGRSVRETVPQVAARYTKLFRLFCARESLLRALKSAGNELTNSMLNMSGLPIGIH